MDKKQELLRLFPVPMRALLGGLPIDFGQLQEIRLRAQRPVLFYMRGREYCMTKQGSVSEDVSEGYILSRNELREILELISSYSLYAYEEEIRNGYLTIQGGHRIGIAGKTVMESARLQTIRHISFLNIRVSHQVKGCADVLMPYLYREDEFLHTVLVSPPGCGKTTLLRDIIRQISDGSGTHRGRNVAVVDERSEIGACYQGIPQNDLGMRTDVLDGCPKAAGMSLLLRTMNPRVIAVDEIGGEEDLKAMREVMKSGCRLLATAHAASLEELRRRPVFQEIFAEDFFERIVVLGQKEQAGQIREIWDGAGNRIHLTGGKGKIA